MTRRSLLCTPFFLLKAADPKPTLLLAIARGWRGVSAPWANAEIHAPALEKFAREAVVFPRAYTACPQPEHARDAILSGCYPHEASKRPTLAEALQKSFQLKTLNARSERPADSDELRLRENVPPEEAEAARTNLASRYGDYSAMDAQFGKLLDTADPAKTIVVFTSDCGEQIGSHGIDGAGIFYEESVRVPLAIRIPGVRPSMSDLLISHVDLMPTLLTLCGADPVEGVQGRDLSSLIAEGHGERRESLLSEGKLGERDEWRMLLLGVDKIVTDASGNATHLFNLAEDPFEKTNLARDPKSELKRAQLLAMMRAERSRLLDFRRR